MLTQKFSNITSIMSTIDAKLKNFLDDKIEFFFDDVTVKVSFNSPEAGFMKLVSFFYILMHEDNSKVNYKFINDRIQTLQGNNSLLSDFKLQIHSFRTVLQHNLKLSKSSDLNKLYDYEDWINKLVNKTPDQLVEEDWEICCDVLIEKAYDVLQLIENVIDDIDKLPLEFKETVKEDWIGKLTNNYPIYMYHEIVNVTIKKYDCPYLDVKRFCLKHYSDWLHELADLPSYEFQDFATKQVERDFLDDFHKKNLPLPITADDIMDFFNLTPSKQIGNLMKQAKEIYSNTPCSKETLLQSLQL